MTLPANHSPEDLAKWEARLVEVDRELQPMLNEYYRQGLHKSHFRFLPGDAVLAMHQSFYHQGDIFTYYRIAVPPTFFPPGTDFSAIDNDQWIPTHLVRYTGWTIRTDEEIPENELISRSPSEPCHITGLLYAHEWNTFLRTKRGWDEPQCGRSAWFMNVEDYRALEKVWQKATGIGTGFAEYCGRSAETTNAISVDVFKKPAASSKKSKASLT